ncbi:TonB-dependent receptor [Steroidobacter denitrificans]|uniref:TonB-dependent receptor n=1 Tax=Steroidobacter denitrificans TaxID=465721 RepID=A0A127FER8_STEDE|nr:TonB-dependent receptor [Steroidobacter denitrificans]AMN48415.1 TonB-dependent receptor [Steroidobacter denitrificans]
MRTLQRICLLSLSITSISVPAWAEEVIVVTATRFAQSASDVGQSISVIDEQSLIARQNDAIVDVLRTVPGVSFVRNGGVGTSTSLFIRGAESDHTVVLIDGVKLNDPSAPGGGFNFGNMLLGNVTRVEALRGSQSIVWGSQAIGGVVNLTTAEPTEVFKGVAKLEYGSHGTSQAGVNLSQRFGRVAASMGVNGYDTDGISAFNKARGGREKDDYRNISANAKFTIDLTDDAWLDLRGWYSKAKTGIDGFPPPTYAFGDTREEARTREAVGYAGVNFDLLAGRFHNRVAYAYTETSRTNEDPDSIPIQTFDADGENARFEYQGTFEFTPKLASGFGLESETSKFNSSSYGGPVTRGKARIDGAYLQLIGKPIDHFTIIAGVRRDDHDEFGGRTNVGGSLAWSPNQGSTTLRASYNEAFKAPSLYQLQSEYGNGLLTPETAESWDVGLAQRFWRDKGEIGVTYFIRDTKDLINFVSCAAPLAGICTNRPFGTYDNVAQARADGFELTLALEPVNGLMIQTNYSRIDTENRSPGANYGNRLARRPGETANLLIDYRWPFDLETGVTYTKNGRSYDNATNTRIVDGYKLVDLRLAYRVGEKMLLQARIENLLDEEYETVYLYGTYGRSYYAGVRFDF